MGQQLPLLFKGEAVYIETIFSSQTPQGTIIVQPMGVKLAGLEHSGKTPLLHLRVYPKTKLYDVVWGLIDACIAVPATIEDYIHAVTAPYAVKLEPASAIRSPCLSNRVVAVETILVEKKVQQETGIIHVFAEPVEIDASWKGAGYSRALGCTIELLVWYTRALAATRYIVSGVEARSYWCKRLIRYMEALPAILECIEHTAEERVKIEAYKLASRIIMLSSLAGCPPPEDSVEVLAQVYPRPQL